MALSPHYIGSSVPTTDLMEQSKLTTSSRLSSAPLHSCKHVSRELGAVDYCVGSTQLPPPSACSDDTAALASSTLPWTAGSFPLIRHVACLPCDWRGQGSFDRLRRDTRAALDRLTTRHAASAMARGLDQRHTSRAMSGSGCKDYFGLSIRLTTGRGCTS